MWLSNYCRTTSSNIAILCQYKIALLKSSGLPLIKICCNLGKAFQAAVSNSFAQGKAESTLSMFPYTVKCKCSFSKLYCWLSCCLHSSYATYCKRELTAHAMLAAFSFHHRGTTEYGSLLFFFETKQEQGQLAFATHCCAGWSADLTDEKRRVMTNGTIQRTESRAQTARRLLSRLTLADIFISHKSRPCPSTRTLTLRGL